MMLRVHRRKGRVADFGTTDFSRPFGTWRHRLGRRPNVETLGYFRLSLRDSPESDMQPVKDGCRK